MRRKIYFLGWNKHKAVWQLTTAGGPAILSSSTREQALSDARTYCRTEYRSRGRLCQLRVRGKTDGRVQFEHTYGADPKRYKS